jgi:hypothetical protein
MEIISAGTDVTGDRRACPPQAGSPAIVDADDYVDRIGARSAPYTCPANPLFVGSYGSAGFLAHFVRSEPDLRTTILYR